MKKNIVITISIIILFILIFAIVLIFIVKHKETVVTQEPDTSIVSYYNSPVIPEGFHSVDTETAKWNKLEDGSIEGWNSGLVIEDNIGNQFVWVPVYKETLEYNIGNIPKEFKYDINSLNEKNIEYRQILNYGGFYISRYEAGIPSELQNVNNNISEKTNDIQGIPVSKKGIIPWNYISMKNANDNAKDMYHSNNISSGMITSKQWQIIINWISMNGYNVYNSAEFGNYSNVNFEFTGYYSEDYGKSYKFGENHLKSGKNMILSTGATDRNMTNNIYDLAGNLMEYVDNENIYICNGGYYDYMAGGASDTWVFTGEPSSNIGFRIVLYL